jgi:hypothetical protein
VDVGKNIWRCLRCDVGLGYIAEPTAKTKSALTVLVKQNVFVPVITYRSFSPTKSVETTNPHLSTPIPISLIRNYQSVQHKYQLLKCLWSRLTGINSDRTCIHPPANTPRRRTILTSIRLTPNRKATFNRERTLYNPPSPLFKSPTISNFSSFDNRITSRHYSNSIRNQYEGLKPL